MSDLWSDAWTLITEGSGTMYSTYVLHCYQSAQGLGMGSCIYAMVHVATCTHCRSSINGSLVLQVVNIFYLSSCKSSLKVQSEIYNNCPLSFPILAIRHPHLRHCYLSRFIITPSPPWFRSCSVYTWKTQLSPCKGHLRAAKRVLRYLKQSASTGIVYSGLIYQPGRFHSVRPCMIWYVFSAWVQLTDFRCYSHSGSWDNRLPSGAWIILSCAVGPF